MLQKLKEKAQVLKKENVQQMENSVLKTVEDLKEAGMYKASQKLDAEYQTRIKRARISEFGYKIIKSADVVNFTRKLKRPSAREIWEVVGIVAGFV